MKSRIIFVTLLLFILINLACVSAIDNQTADIGALNAQNILEDENVDLYSQVEQSNLTSYNSNDDDNIISDETLGDSPYTFTQLNQLISGASKGSTVTLSNDYKYNPSTDSALVGGITIDKSLTINGQGHTLDGNGQAAIFYIYDFMTHPEVTIKNTNFINSGETAVNYGAFTVGTVENCVFINNTGTLGGAFESLYWCEMKNCKFYNNTANEGGAINAHNIFEISDSEFVNNAAKYGSKNGGAIYYTYSSISEEIYAEIVNCKFMDNFAEFGGAIYSQSCVRLTNCESRNNRASEKGGVIFSFSYVDIISSIFENNSAKTIGVVSSNQPLTMTDSTFIANHVNQGCGVLYADFEATINKCTFINNTAGTDSAVGYINVHVTMSAQVTNSIFINNTAKSDAGTLKVFGTGHFTGCTFTHNGASNLGGALEITNNGYVTNCNFTDNYVIGSGGAIHFNQMGVLTNCIFTGNTATQSGGALQVLGWGSMNNCTFTSNSAGNEGGAVLLKSTGDSTNSRFIENTAELGGAISSYSSLTMSNSKFENNMANTGVNNIALRGSAGLVNVNSTPGKLGPFRILNIKVLAIINNVNYGESQKITVELTGEGPKVTDDTVFIVIGDKNYTAHVVNGIATIVIDNLEGGSYSDYISDTNENYTKPQANVEFKVVKKQISFEVTEISNIVFGETESITITADEKISDGTISIIFNNEEYSADVINGTATFAIPSLDAKDYVGYVIYNGKNYYADLKQIRFNVAKRDVSLAVDVANHTYGELVEITVNVASGNLPLDGENVIFVFNNLKYVVPVENGIAKLEIQKLNAGDYASEIYFDGGNNYNSQTINATFSIFKKIVSIGAISKNITYGDKEIIIINVLGNDGKVTEGMVLLELNDKQYVGVVDNGTVRFEFQGLTAGNYVCNVVYNGEDNYNRPTDATKFSVDKGTVKLAVNFTNVTYGDVLRVCVNVTSNDAPVNEGYVTVGVDDKNHTAKVENGTAIVEIPDLNAGMVRGNVAFNSDNYYSVVYVISTDVSKRSVDFAFNFTNITYGNVLKVAVNVTSNNISIYGGNVIISVNNENYTANVENGFALVEIANLGAGVYDANITFDDGVNFNKVVKPISFEVSPCLVDIAFNVTDVTYGDILKVYVDVLLEGVVINEGNVSIVFNNERYSVKIENGSAVVEIPNLNAGSYFGNIEYYSNNYGKVAKLISFQVLKRNATIAASDKAYIINYGGKYSVTVKGVVGENVMFTFNGKNIASVVIDANGVATILLTANVLKVAKAGTKNLIIKLDSSNYQVPVKTVKITVNKEKTKIDAKMKTFKKAKKVKKYTITLENSKNKAVQNVKVTLKVKGKTFKAKTNAKGKAVFKIKKLTKKGNFKAKITFKGNQYYNKVTKTVKIKIK